MREVNIRFARRVETMSLKTNVGEKQRLAEVNRAEVLTFSRMWDDKMLEYDAQAQRIMEDLLDRHNQHEKWIQCDN